MLEVQEQLREELYQVAKDKLALEEKMKSLDFYIRTLKRELDRRQPAT